MAEIKKVIKNWTTYDLLNSDNVGSALTGGTGISITGNTISNSGVTSVNGSNWAVTVSEFSPTWTPSVWDVVTKTAGGYEWKAPTGWISLDANSPITVSKLWVGTEAQYSALGSYDSSTVYMTV